MRLNEQETKNYLYQEAPANRMTDHYNKSKQGQKCPKHKLWITDTKAIM